MHLRKKRFGSLKGLGNTVDSPGVSPGLHPVGVAGKARAAPERDAEAVADRGRTPALFLPVAPCHGRATRQYSEAFRARFTGASACRGRAPARRGVRPGVAESSVRRGRALARGGAQGGGGRASSAATPQPVFRCQLECLDRAHRRHSAFGYSLGGRIEGQPHSGVTLVVNGGILAGAVHSQQGAYVIAFRNGPIHTIREIVGDLKCGSTADLTGRWLGKTQAPSTRNAIFGGIFGDNGSEVDVLVLFTEAAFRAEGGLRQMRAGIDLAVAFTNDAYEASGVNFR